MTFEQLKILQSIVEEGGVIAASKILFKTQPAISNAISRLETELQVQFFSRDEYRLRLSTEGQALYEQMKIILKHVEIVRSMAAHMSQGNESEDGRIVPLDIKDMPLYQIDIFAFKDKIRPLGPISTIIWQELCKLSE